MRARSLVWMCALLLASCGTLPNGRRWGEDATLLPGGERLARAARDAALDGWTWVPLAGAGVVAVTGWDQQITDWASDHTPIFGSTQGAKDASDTLRNVSRLAWLGSMAATPSGDEPLDWSADKLKGFLVEWSATELTTATTSLLKSTFPRERPDGSDDSSFPSSGAAETQSYVTLSNLNLDAMGWDPGVRKPVQIGLQGVAIAEAWSRIEAGKHHPTDVMVGLAVGNFVSRFVHDAFLGLPQDVGVSAYVPPDGGFVLGVTFRF